MRAETERAQKTAGCLHIFVWDWFLKDDGLCLTFYRYMSNSPPVIFTNGIIYKSKPDLERSVKMLLGLKRFSPHTLTKIELLQ